jgi:hypothetical protein
VEVTSHQNWPHHKEENSRPYWNDNSQFNDIGSIEDEDRESDYKKNHSVILLVNMEHMANFRVTYPQTRRANGKLSIKARLLMPNTDWAIEYMNLAYVDASHEIGIGTTASDAPHCQSGSIYCRLSDPIG